jgi:branched-chain amino acid transport system permease protein
LIVRKGTETPWAAKAAWILLAGILMSLPLFTHSRSTLSMVNMILTSAVFALSYNLLVGYTGILSLGHALFFGGGAYAVGIMMRHVGPSLWVLFLAILVALVFAVLAGLFVGYLTLRLRTIYYAMVTLAVAELLVILAEKSRSLTGGLDGLNYRVPELFRSPVVVYYMVLIYAIMALYLVHRFLDSPTGKVLVSIRENEHRASSLGFDVFRYKLISSVAAGILASLTGVVFAVENRFVMTNLLAVDRTLEALFMTIIGGMGTLPGPFVGAAVYHLAGDWLSSLAKVHPLFERWPVLFGCLYIVITLTMPTGIVSVYYRLKLRLQRRTKGES